MNAQVFGEADNLVQCWILQAGFADAACQLGRYGRVLKIVVEIQGRKRSWCVELEIRFRSKLRAS